MFARPDFIACISDNLASHKAGAKRIKEVTDAFKRKVDDHIRAGLDPNDANIQAMADTFDVIRQRTLDNSKAIAKSVAVHAEAKQRIAQASDVDTSRIAFDGGSGSQGTAIGRAIISMLTPDPRFKGVNYEGVKQALRGKYWSMMSDVIDKMGKGAFGRQKGKAHANNIVHEIFNEFGKGRATGDGAAGMFAKAYGKVKDTMLDDFNRNGGSMARLEDFGLPQRMSSTKILKGGRKAFIERHMNDWLDWDRMRWPDGSRIAPEERADVLGRVFDTLSTGGKTNINEVTGRGTGRGSLGDALDKHRFLVYKSSDAWLEAHTSYGEGTVFDVVAAHIENMSHKTAMVRMFGRSPVEMVRTLHGLAEKEAAKVTVDPKNKRDMRSLEDAKSALRKFDVMFENANRYNEMDVHNPWAASVQATSHVLMSAQLGSLVFLSIPGDFAQTALIRLSNHQQLHGLIGSYIRAWTSDIKTFEKQAAQMGFVYDSSVAGHYAALERFTGFASRAPHAANVVSSTVMRLTGINHHTNVARFVNAQEMMARLHNVRNTPLDKLPERAMMERYGIGADEWDAIRKNIGAWEPREGALFMRPLDILDTKLENKHALYERMMAMIDAEARTMVPSATLESQSVLRSTLRPDTLLGALAQSFSMYKNFPIAVITLYGRRGLTHKGGGRLAFYAGMGLMLTMTGALGLQMRELANGREPLDMTKPSFWGKAILAGGATAIWGDLLFSGVNEYDNRVAAALAGPIAGFAQDVATLILGEPFAFISAAERGEQYKTKLPERLVRFAQRNTPGTSLWWARLALEREVWDRLHEAADPRAYQKQRARIRKQYRERGNEYWLPPGERMFTER